MPIPSGAAKVRRDRSSINVLVLGGGILGCLTALHCAREGMRVALIEREPLLWNRASRHNEGKVHLGLVYALGFEKTRRGMLHDAVRFAPDLESATGTAIDWSRLATDPFEYVAMPDSALGIEELAERYRRLNDLYDELGRPPYLGEQPPQLAEVEPTIDIASGRQRFHTAERAVDPVRLRSIVIEAIAREPLITVHLDEEALVVEWTSSRAITAVRRAGRSIDMVSSAVVDCRWERQGSGVAGLAVRPRSLRVKAAVRVASTTPLTSATLVAGPYGDVVQHRDYAYLSWYPAARLHHEYLSVPSSAADQALAQVSDPTVVARQLAALHDLGLIPDDVEVIEGVGGFIVGEGPRDISDPDSALHDRVGSGVVQHGRVFMPRSLKFSSAPTAARRTAEAVRQMVHSL